MSLKALKVECKQRGLKVSGKKAELAKRLKAATSKDVSRLRKPDVQTATPAQSRMTSKPDNTRTRVLDNGPKLASRQQDESKTKIMVNGSVRVAGIPRLKQDGMQLRSLNQSIMSNKSTKPEPSSKEPVLEIHINTTQQPSPVGVLAQSAASGKNPITNNRIEAIRQRKPTQAFSQDEPKDITLQDNNHSRRLANNTPLQKDTSPLGPRNGDSQDESSSRLCLRDKLFLLTSTSLISIWWWWPYVPNIHSKIMRSYNYLQSLL